MNNILEEIVRFKKKEVEKKKVLFNPSWYKLHSEELERTGISLKQSLTKRNSSGIIAEFKRRSPSKGEFKPAEFDAAPVVASYESSGAAAVSILTDTEFFGGRLEDIMKVRSSTKIPILRKDFMIDEVQVHEAKTAGADVILLIAGILTPQRVKDLAREAKHYGLEVLLELHEENELEHICDETEIIGINNRNLKNFKVDLDHSFRMAEKLPKNKVKVAESGISSAEAVTEFREKGFKGFLIGELFMKKKDPGSACSEFIAKLKN